MLFDNRWETQQAEIQAALSQHMQLIPDCPPRLLESMSYSLLAGGKRLRPILVLMACEACGGDPAAAMPAACAVEMVHTYSLIHDDLPAMDDDALRRGRPTNHVVFGEAMAILAGDALLTLAFEVLARDIRPEALAARCCLDLAGGSGWTGMVAGQVADIESEQAIANSRASRSASGTEPVKVLQSAGTETTESSIPEKLHQLEAIHRRKTGRLLLSCLTLGARIGGATAEQLSALVQYGERLGLAFQITDDLLDVQGSAAKMGKGVGKDAALGKLTYPGLLGLHESRLKAERLITEARSALHVFAESRQRLDALAVFVLERDH